MTSTYSTFSDYSLTELIELLADLTGQPEENFQELGFFDALEEINTATDF